PPGAVETSLFNRVEGIDISTVHRILYEEKKVLQSWSISGAPYVFPTAERQVFTDSLIPQNNEPWIYTDGITLALDKIDMPFDHLLELAKEAIIPLLEGRVVKSKRTLDSELAAKILPKIPNSKKNIWLSSSIYGKNQTLGEGIVSFLLRPLSFMGLI